MPTLCLTSAQGDVYLVHTEQIASAMTQRREEFARALCIEAGKPIKSVFTCRFLFFCACYMKSNPPKVRTQTILVRVVHILTAGTPTHFADNRDARGEIDRGILTFKIAAEEAVRIYGEYGNARHVRSGLV